MNSSAASHRTPASEMTDLCTEIAKTNLNRMWWLLLTSTSLSVAFALANLFIVQEAGFAGWQILDIGGSLVFLVLLWTGRRGKLPAGFCWGLSPAYFIFWLILMDGYYFTALLRFGENATYAIGVVTPAILILLPPRIFLSLLLPNHLIFCAILFYLAATHQKVADAFFSSFANGSLGVLVAALGAWFLYSARRANFRYERLLNEKNQEARNAASHLQAMLENIPFQAWLLDRGGTFLAVNGQFAEATGLPLNQIVGKTLYDLYTVARADQYRREDEEIMRTGEKAYFEQSLSAGDHLVWHEVLKSRVVDDHGAVVGTVGLARNITERKEMEERLQAADKAKSEFLAVMSHEIRTPMNIVLGYANLLRDMPMEPVQKEHVESILHSGQLLLSIINDILDFSKIEAGKLPLQEEPIRLREMAATLTKMFQPLAEKKGFALECVVAPEVPEVLLSDFHRIEQILVNLLSNAVKFTEAGSVTMSVSAQMRDSSRNLWEIFFQVKDTGIGITSEQMERLFQPFTQADTTMARRYSGTGLGLVIVRKLCELMDGSIEVETKAGQGSTFTASICAQEVCQTPSVSNATAPSTEEAPVDFSQKRVLVVEDNLSNRKLIAIILKRWGITATLVESGEEAARLVQGVAYDIILMDVQMPGMDGFETTRKIREWEDSQPGRRRSHIVALTALAMVGDRARCLDAGMDDYLSKPIKPEALKRAIQNALPQ